MTEIKLTLSVSANVDETDYDSLAAYKWHASKKRQNSDNPVWYAQRVTSRSTGRKTILMHRMLMGFPEGMVDHINGDGLDNRRENLRVVTRSQNSLNSHRRRNGETIGVTKLKNGSYQAQLTVDGKVKYLGCFKEKEQARNRVLQKEKEIGL